MIRLGGYALVLCWIVMLELISLGDVIRYLVGETLGDLVLHHVGVPELEFNHYAFIFYIMVFFNIW